MTRSCLDEVDSHRTDMALMMLCRQHLLSKLKGLFFLRYENNPTTDPSGRAVTEGRKLREPKKKKGERGCGNDFSPAIHREINLSSELLINTASKEYADRWVRA